MTRRIAFIVTAALLLLVGCGATSTAGDSGSDLHEQRKTLSDGRTVTCVYYYGIGGRGGLSCDWESAG